jgi:translocator protein
MSATTTTSTTATSRLAQRERPLAPLAMVAAFIVVFAAAAIGSAATTAEIPGWYRALDKPWFTPPDWVFGPVWTVLYAIMALVLWQIWRTRATDAAESRLRRTALVAFAVQLVLNVSWSVVFFGLNSLAGGMAVIVLLWAAIVWTMLAARPVIGDVAMWAFAPYLAWVTFAAVLNLSILVLNL